MVQAFEDTRPRPLRAPHPCRAAAGSHRTTSTPRSRCSGPCCCPATPLGGIELCAAEDFYKPAHGHIFEAITPLFQRGSRRPGDRRRRARARACSTPSATRRCSSRCRSTPRRRPTPALRRDRRGARPAAPARRGGGRDRRARLLASPRTCRRCVDRAEPMVFEVAQRRVVDTMRPLRDLLAESLDHLEDLFERGDAITGVPTGYGDLDERPAGLQTSNLVVVGARPAMGKTSFALGIVANAGVHVRAPGPALLPRDEPPRAHPAPAVLRGARSTPPGCAPAGCSSRTGPRSPTPSAGWATRRSSSTTTRTSPSWTSGPRPAA